MVDDWGFINPGVCNSQELLMPRMGVARDGRCQAPRYKLWRSWKKKKTSIKLRIRLQDKSARRLLWHEKHAFAWYEMKSGAIYFTIGNSICLAKSSDLNVKKWFKTPDASSECKSRNKQAFKNVSRMKMTVNTDSLVSHATRHKAVWSY